MEIHLVYGELAAKKFVFPIAKSSNKKFLVFYQREGFGYALLEGALMGNALASFELIGPYSIIKNTCSGICLPLGTKPEVFANEISKLILNTNHLACLMKNAWTTAKKYDRQLVLKSARQHIN